MKKIKILLSLILVFTLFTPSMTSAQEAEVEPNTEPKITYHENGDITYEYMLVEYNPKERLLYPGNAGKLRVDYDYGSKYYHYSISLDYTVPIGFAGTLTLTPSNATSTAGPVSIYVSGVSNSIYLGGNGLRATNYLSNLSGRCQGADGKEYALVYPQNYPIQYR